MKQMSTLTLGKNIYEINDAIARKLITELSKNLDNIKVVDGKSAYEIAVENGFIGSETDWLASLKGEQGDIGNRISNISYKETDSDGNYIYTITLTDNSSYDIIVPISNGEEITNETTVSQELKANYFYLFNTAVENLTITLPSNRRPWNEFNFAFTTSSSGCNLALPSAVTWMGDTPTLDADTYYEVSIKNDKAVIG